MNSHIQAAKEALGRGDIAKAKVILGQLSSAGVVHGNKPPVPVQASVERDGQREFISGAMDPDTGIYDIGGIVAPVDSINSLIGQVYGSPVRAVQITTHDY